MCVHREEERRGTLVMHLVACLESSQFQVYFYWDKLAGKLFSELFIHWDKNWNERGRDWGWGLDWEWDCVQTQSPGSISSCLGVKVSLTQPHQSWQHLQIESWKFKVITKFLPRKFTLTFRILRHSRNFWTTKIRSYTVYNLPTSTKLLHYQSTTRKPCR